MGNIKVKKVRNMSIPSGLVNAHVLTIDDYILFTPSAYLFSLTSKARSEHTVVNYGSDLKAFYKHLFFHFKDKYKDLKGIDVYAEKNDLYRLVDQGLVDAWFKSLKEGENSKAPLKNRSLNRIKHVILEFYRYVWSIGLTDKILVSDVVFESQNATSTVSKGITTNLASQYYSEESFKEVILSNISTKNSFINSRDRLALKICYGMGLRPHELLRENNFDIKRLKEKISNDSSFEAVDISITGKRDKTRTVTISPKLVDSLRAFIYEDIARLEKKNGDLCTGCIFTNTKLKTLESDKFLGNAFRKAKREFIVKKKPDKEKIRFWKNVEPYSMRHCYATSRVIYCIKAKLPYKLIVTEELGHESFETTLNYIYFAALLMLDDSDPETNKYARCIFSEAETELASLKAKGRA